MERVLGSVSGSEDGRALRLAFKRGRAAADRGVVAVTTAAPYQLHPQALSQSQLSALIGAPWRLQRLEIWNCQVGAEGAAALAAAAWPGLVELVLYGSQQ